MLHTDQLFNWFYHFIHNFNDLNECFSLKKKTKKHEHKQEEQNILHGTIL